MHPLTDKGGIAPCPAFPLHHC